MLNKPTCLYYMDISNLKDKSKFVLELNKIEDITDDWDEEDLTKQYIVVQTSSYKNSNDFYIQTYRTNELPKGTNTVPIEIVMYDPNEIHNLMKLIKLEHLLTDLSK